MDAKYRQSLVDMGLLEYDINLIDTAYKLDNWWEMDIARDLMKKAIDKRAYQILRCRYNFLYHLAED